jgi:hypothetical protein
MSFRETQAGDPEDLRRWLRDEIDRAIARLSLVARQTVKRYVTAGVECGLVSDGDVSQLTEELVGHGCAA